MDKERAIQIIRDYEALKKSVYPLVIREGTTSYDVWEEDGNIKIATGWFDFNDNTEVPDYFIEESC